MINKIKEIFFGISIIAFMLAMLFWMIFSPYIHTPEIEIVKKGVIQKIQYGTEITEFALSTTRTDYIVIFWIDGDFSKIEAEEGKGLKLNEGYSGQLFWKKSAHFWESRILIFKGKDNQGNTIERKYQRDDYEE